MEYTVASFTTGTPICRDKGRKRCGVTSTLGGMLIIKKHINQ
jgi:hypothetical protein